MAKAYIHLDSIDTLEEYKTKLYDWKHQLYDMHKQMINYHATLATEQRWYGQSHDEFYENNIIEIYNRYFQAAAAFLDEECVSALTNLKKRAEELGIR